MLLFRRLLIVGLLASATSACDNVSRYVSGMDDPKSFTWEKGEPAARQMRQPVSATDRERREHVPGIALGGGVSGTMALPKPVAATTSSPAAASTSAKDLRDCQAPDLQATGAEARASAGAITIERSANSPAVAECMIEKGYRKVYKTRSDMF
jgi:hypothetical protein